MSLAILAAERRWVPEPVLRKGIRRLVRARIREVSAANDLERQEEDLAIELRKSPVALHQITANEQHYELPPRFFELMLGSHLKYSCGLWNEGTEALDASEEAMLELTCRRASLEDGMDILELGCGWGSLSLWMAENQPNSRIVAVSNSTVQRNYINRKAQERGIENLEVRTCDVSYLDPGSTFDRVVSVEMFEHLRNYSTLLNRIGSWLRPEGHLFVHIFCNRTLAYPFESEGADNWMGRHFFTGGLMPSFDLFRRFQETLQIDHQWWVDGTHYQRTAEAWLAKLDQNRTPALAILAEGYGDRNVAVRLQRWRMFLMSCSEMFGYEGGSQWGVGHYLWSPR